MSIPLNITKEHLLKAIGKIDNEGFPNDGDSQYYDVIFNGKRYPPKVIASYANIYANGFELKRNTFPGGLNTPCFKLLEENDFVIKPKQMTNEISYFEELQKFLEQSKKSELKTAHYEKKYLDLDVKVSFGQGNIAKVPWISFLGKDQTTSNGIYPVYLLYKDCNKLILAYGVSETKDPGFKWEIKEPTLSNFFKENNLGDPKPYPNSIVFQSYELAEGLNKDRINSDLQNLIAIYKQTLENQQKNDKSKQSDIEFSYKIFQNNAGNANLYFNENLCSRFIASLITKPFVILTGLSGSGKTKLAQAFVSWICENKNQYCIVPVGADWTNREPLLGFPNALLERDYKKDEYGVLNLFLEANNNLDKPYFLILDEMNLSHVERYFADFLSVMESKSRISLHSGNEDWNNIPSEMLFPKNLFIIGTVNIDETTYMFSPKVLDRANVIEFRVTREEMENYLQNNTVINLGNLEGLGVNMASSFVEIAKDNTLEITETNELNNTLINFFSELKKTGAEFGYRTASEIIRFASVVNKIDNTWIMTDIIDAAIMQKLLPKVHGSRRKLEPVLKTLGQLCVQENQKIDDFIIPNLLIDLNDRTKVKYPISLEKILRMYSNLISNGFTSYAEA